MCIRCYGVYSGIAAAALLGLPFTKRIAFAGAVALAGVWAIEHLAGAAVPELARFASGGAFGLAVASVTTGPRTFPTETVGGVEASNG